MNSYLLTSLPPTPPPTAELFTREWLNPILLDPFPFETKVVEVFQTYKDRAIDTKRKLGILNTYLDKYNSALFGNAVLGVQHTVGWMREKVGLWYIVKVSEHRWAALDVLSRHNELPRHTLWDGFVWGEEEKENGLVFVMLDGTAVTWLNEVHKWCNEVAKDNERETI